MDGNSTGTAGTQTMAPIALNNILTDAKITYGMMVWDHRPLKKEKHRCTRLVVLDIIQFQILLDFGNTRQNQFSFAYVLTTLV